MKRILMFSVTSALAAGELALPQVMNAQEGTFVSGGVPLHYTDEGTGPAVLMLHAFAGSSALWQSNGMMALEAMRTIAFDARGHGESGKPATPDAYGVAMIDDILRLMDARGVAQAHIVGYSMGAETALKFAVEHPERVLSLVVAGSGWSGEEEAQTYGFVSDALNGVATFGDFMAAMSAGDASEEMSEEEQMAGFAMLAAHGISPGQDAAPLAAAAGSMNDLIGMDAEALAALPFPVLGIAGETDEERDNVEQLAEAIGDFTFVMIPDADHLSAPLTPLFTETVSGFLRN